MGTSIIRSEHCKWAGRELRRSHRGHFEPVQVPEPTARLYLVWPYPQEGVVLPVGEDVAIAGRAFRTSDLRAVAGAP
jgi:hypothetical protein